MDISDHAPFDVLLNALSKTSMFIHQSCAIRWNILAQLILDIPLIGGDGRVSFIGLRGNITVRVIRIGK